MILFPLHNKRGLTLSELTIAAILMGIVMLGVLSVDFAVRSMDKTTKSGALTAMRLSTALLRISKDAERAIGDNIQWGIRGIKDAQRNNICFRHDFDNPNSYADDTWVCYSQTGADNRLYRCESAAAPPEDMIFDCSDYPPATPILRISRTDFFTIGNSFVEIVLQTRADVTAPEHSLDNPQYEMRTRITPLAHSF